MRRALFLFALLFAATVSFAQTATQSVLYTFTNSDGDNTLAGLIQGSDGNFYGVAPYGSSTGDGTVFKITPAGVLTTLYTFTGGNDGSSPSSNLVQGTDGNFYGTTASGGANSGQGTVFKITPAGVLTTLYTFTGGNDGGDIYSGLVQGTDGNFYGTTEGGGASGNGTVFMVTPSGTETTLYSFTSGLDGGNPYSGLVQGADGNFYGITPNGGLNGFGAIFKITPMGTLTTIYAFTGLLDGGYVQDGLVQGGDGNFYGTEQSGGTNTQGSIFKITPSGTFTTVYSFTGGVDQGYPRAALALGSDGNFYGTTTNNSTFDGNGTVFQVTPSGNLTTLYTFTGVNDGGYPRGIILQGNDGNLYGTTAYDGANSDGVIYKTSLSPALTAPVQLSFSSPTIDLGTSATLSWKVLNGFSATMQQCFASIQSPATGAGTWTGLQTGALANGVYSGSAGLAPTAEGTYTYALTCGGQESGFATLTVGAPAPLAITTTNLPTGTVGTAYSTTLAATGGIPPYTWSVVSGALPEGLSLAAGTGVISGTPTQSDSGNLMIQVQDSEATPVVATTTTNLTIVAPLAVTTTTLPAGTVGIAYSATLAATGGTAPYTWSITSGTLPAGLTLAAGTGVISGTPTASGTADLVIQVQDSESTPATATASPSLMIAAATPVVSVNPTTVAISGPGSSGSATVSVSEFLTNTITFACTGLPSGATCSFGALSGTGTSGTATLQIATAAATTSSLATPVNGSSSHLAYALALPGLLAIAGLFSRRRRLGQLSALLMLLCAGITLTACGSSGSSGGKTTTVPGTPAGSSTVTVTATAGTQSATTTLTVTVQ